MAFCTKCGNQLAGGENFCSACGTPTEVGVLAPTVQSPAYPPQPLPYAAPPVVVASSVPHESGMGAAVKGLLVWFILTVILMVASLSASSDTRVVVALIAGVISAAYIVGKVRAGRRRGAVVSNVWAAYCAVLFLIAITVALMANNTSRPSPSASNQSSPAGATTTAQTPPQPATPISADSLFNAYDQNEVSADQAYKGRTMRISGRVGSINKDFTDSVYIVLPSTENMFEGIHAEIEDSESGQAASLRKGERVTLTCEVQGKVLTDVMVKHCVLNQ